MRLKLIALAALVCTHTGTSWAQPVIQTLPERPRIIVDGQGEVKTAPDVATISYTLRGEGPTSDDAVRAMVAAGVRIEVAIHGVDANAEPRTGDVKVTPVKSDDCKEQDDSSPQLSTGPCAVLGYVARQSTTVRTAAVTDAGTIVGLVGRGGGFDAQISSFDIRDQHAAQRRATAAALSDAAAKASAIAEATRIDLGSILSVSTTSRYEEQEVVVAGQRRAAPAMALPPPVLVTIKPELITTSANVTVTYAIGR